MKIKLMKLNSFNFPLDFLLNSDLKSFEDQIEFQDHLSRDEVIIFLFIFCSLYYSFLLSLPS